MQTVQAPKKTTQKTWREEADNKAIRSIVVLIVHSSNKTSDNTNLEARQAREAEQERPKSRVACVVGNEFWRPSKGFPGSRIQELSGNARFVIMAGKGFRHEFCAIVWYCQ